MAEDILKDLDMLDPPKKLVKMSGEIIDISFIPSRVTLTAMRISLDLEKKKITADEMFEKMIEIIVHISENSNPTITAEWLYDHVSVEKITKFLNLIVSVETENDDKTGTSGEETAKN